MDENIIIEQGKQIAHLSDMNRKLISQLTAHRQCVDEYLNSNISLRSSAILLEDDIKVLKNRLSQFSDMIDSFHQEKAELLNQIEKLTNSKKRK